MLPKESKRNSWGSAKNCAFPELGQLLNDERRQHLQEQNIPMHHSRYNWRRLLSIVPIIGLVFALTSRAQSAPKEQGRATFQRTCSPCHRTSRITSHRLSHAGWENVVDNMISRGAKATPDEQEQIVGYLTANFGIGTPAPKKAASGARSVPAKMPRAPVLDDSQIARAKQLVKSSGCLSCHRMGGEGSFAGPYLDDVGANNSAKQIRAAMISPREEIAPQNRSVRLATQDGKTVVGKLLNQDGFTVQLIDAPGHLLSFQKADLREFTIITTNSMPSYANKLAPQDLSLLVNYLSTLRGTGQQ
ncbi:MAG TPA: c-type cytochrome [Terriglobia bacterium]|nr:c-type cytochrome [Terriglobia bacterium]